MTADDRESWPPHRPLADPPIPGGPYWYDGCADDSPRVGPDGHCEGCGESACHTCGRERCPDHVDAIVRGGENL